MEEEDAVAFNVMENMPTHVSEMRHDEERVCRMMRLVNACSPTNPLWKQDQVPQRIVSLMADCGVLEKEHFWSKWMDKWMEKPESNDARSYDVQGGVMADGRPPTSILLSIELLSELISAAPDICQSWYHAQA